MINMKWLNGILLVGLVLGSTSQVSASTADCQNLFVGRINVGSDGLRSVVYLNGRSDKAGSYWSTFGGWSVEAKKSALSTLISAKVSGLKVDVTTAQTGCGLNLGRTKTTMITLDQ